ncbi:thiamine pyrophosphate-binding protein [Streptosporangium sandarakinum]|uniref:Thiamine pyrophosphate-dependent acetolactate synthase large subunit-like protein n=1 Tax=Streptosporangium sandarakinum TaxID=1260955 RepID=A0A852UNI9_9ACTN|nr:thiamine pyrophosphate-binding protein [Streptosporangium sandarakinum]NYF38542.1 thiamine pyrophosphate-dependent acetolactate synthase large subunit-like protein [Streptosporangium sandarakinum]
MSAGTVAETVGAVLASLGVDTAFGVVGSGNFHVTNALVAHGVRFVAARHEGGAATMADAHARMTGRVGVLSVHQGPGLTNALTGVTEAAKSRTPLVVLAGEVTAPRSNFFVDQAALAAAVGAVPMRVGSAPDAAALTAEAFRAARDGRRTVLLNLPLEVQALAVSGPSGAGGRETGPAGAAGLAEAGGSAGLAGRTGEARPLPAGPDPVEAARLAEILAGARRPVFVAGRGARTARRELEDLAGLTGALLATSAVAKGLFRGSLWDLDVSGGFASPLAAELIRDADVVVGWGCALNMWTTRHGTLVGPDAVVVQVDLDPEALGAHRPVDLGVTGDVARTARAVADLLGDGTVARPVPGAPAGERGGTRAVPEEAGTRAGPRRAGYRSEALALRIAREVRWRDVPYADESGDGRIDPRTLTIALDDLLPAERVVCPDSGNFMGYPAMFMDVPDEGGFCFTQAFQSIGLGLATAIGAALARPDRLTVAALGDGGALMGVSELETVVRLGLRMVVVVYDDEAYGAEVHHFGPDGHPLDTVVFPPADIAGIARGFGFEAVTVRAPGDLAAVARWLDGPRERPLLVHAKVTRARGAWWLEEAFRGH